MYNGSVTLLCTAFPEVARDAAAMVLDIAGGDVERAAAQLAETFDGAVLPDTRPAPATTFRSRQRRSKITGAPVHRTSRSPSPVQQWKQPGYKSQRCECCSQCTERWPPL